MKLRIASLTSALLTAALLILLSSAAALAAVNANPPVIDDFESGLPGTWFQYGDYGSGTAIATNIVATDLVPGLPGANNVLEIAYTSAGWGAGTGNNLGGQDWSSYDGFSFWFKGANTGGTFRVILSDNPNPAVQGDSAERFAYEFVDNSTGWRHVSIPWGAFFRDPGFQPGGAPNDGLTLTAVQAYAIALPSGTAATVFLDDVRVFKSTPVDDFESGLPGAWFQYGDYGSGTAIATNIVATDTVPGLPGANNALEIVYTSAGWGAGTGNNLGGQDWSSYDGFSFWFKGANTGGTFRVILSDNPNPAIQGDSAERFAYEFVDNSTGWRHVSIPWGAFFRDPGFQPGGAPDDGLTLTEVQAYAIALPSGTAATVFVDEVHLFGDGAGAPPPPPPAPTNTLPVIVDFEDGIPTTLGVFNGSGSSVQLGLDTQAVPQIPGLVTNTVAIFTYTIGAGDYGGITHPFTESQDWTGYDAFGFWLYGSNSGVNHRIELKSQGANAGASNLWQYGFADNFIGWKHFIVPFSEFTKRTDYNPGAGLGDSIDLAVMWGWSLLLDPPSSGVMWLDEVSLFKATTLYDFQAGIPAGFGAFSDSGDGSGSSTALSLGHAAVMEPRRA